MGQICSAFDSVLTVLAITVIIDQKILNPEMSEFCEQAVGLAELYCDEPFGLEDAKTWFIKTQPAILASLEGRGRNTAILKAISAIEGSDLRENLYDAMVTISISDAEYHKHESDLVRSAAAIWGFNRPPLKVADDPKNV